MWLEVSWPWPRNVEPKICHMVSGVSAAQDLRLQVLEQIQPRKFCKKPHNQWWADPAQKGQSPTLAMCFSTKLLPKSTAAGFGTNPTKKSLLKSSDQRWVGPGQETWNLISTTCFQHAQDPQLQFLGPTPSKKSAEAMWLEVNWPRPRNVEPDLHDKLYNLPRRVWGSHLIGEELAHPKGYSLISTTHFSIWLLPKTHGSYWDQPTQKTLWKPCDDRWVGPAKEG